MRHKSNDLKIVKQADSTATFDEVLAGLSRLRHQVVSVQDLSERQEEVDEKARKTDPGPKVEETIDALRAKVEILQQQADYADNMLARYEAEADGRMLSSIESVLENTIIDYYSAYHTTLIYTIDWFSLVLLSENGKVQLASLLLQYVKKHCSSNLATLEKVAARDETVMARIKLPIATS